VLGGGDIAMLKEIDRGENYLKQEYERVLKDTGISPETRAVAGECFEIVRRGHALVLQIKERLGQAA